MEILQGKNHYKESKDKANWEQYFQFISNRAHFLAEERGLCVRRMASKKSRKEGKVQRT